MENQVYERLAMHLSQWVIGTPRSPALEEIFEILFPKEEAEVASMLPLEGKTIEELKVIFPDHSDDLEEILKRMVDRGTVYTSQRLGQDRKYRLLPSVVGWAETPFWDGKADDRSRKLGPLWLKYRNEAFGAELAKGDMPVMRVVPEKGTLIDSRQVLSYDDLQNVVASVSYRAVAHCPCRQMKATTGDACDYPLENCLHFGSMGRFMVERGMAREISVDETMEILKQANLDGLVHMVDNIEGHISTVCNCCGCCCVFLDTQKLMKLHTASSSNYLAVVGKDDCLGCGTCEDRCPMDAVAVVKDGFASVDAEKCIGCGVCQPTCEAEAVALNLRDTVEPPPDLNRFLTARLGL